MDNAGVYSIVSNILILLLNLFFCFTHFNFLIRHAHFESPIYHIWRPISNEKNWLRPLFLASSSSKLLLRDEALRHRRSQEIGELS